jgi:hypothetical protein
MNAGDLLLVGSMIDIAIPMNGGENTSGITQRGNDGATIATTIEVP